MPAPTVEDLALAHIATFLDGSTHDLRDAMEAAAKTWPEVEFDPFTLRMILHDRFDLAQCDGCGLWSDYADTCFG